MINCVDGAGGEGSGYGPCEIVTGGRDGSVKIWDPRQQTSVISLDPVESEVLPDCWAVRYKCNKVASETPTIVNKE